MTRAFLSLRNFGVTFFLCFDHAALGSFFELRLKVVAS